MKKLVSILFLTTLVFSAISCSKDDDGPGGTNIAGTWEYSRAGAIINGEETLIPWEHECPTKKDKLELLGNNVIKAYDYWEDCTLDLGEGTWSYSGDILTVKMDGLTTNAQVLVLTNSTLKLKIGEANDVGHVIMEMIRK